MNRFTLPNSEAVIEIAELTASGETANCWNSTYKVVDGNNAVISGQSFSPTEYFVPSIEIDKALYIARHYQSYVYDGFQWLAAVSAVQE